MELITRVRSRYDEVSRSFRAGFAMSVADRTLAEQCEL
jgi:hypothetical protein